MKYYKVSENLDQKNVYKFNSQKRYWEYSTVLIKDELYTERELKYYGIKPEELLVVNVPKNKTYWFFGCRFEIKG